MEPGFFGAMGSAIIGNFPPASTPPRFDPNKSSQFGGSWLSSVQDGAIMAENEQDPLTPGPGLSRRELLKRAGLVVGAAVVVPVTPMDAAGQTASAPDALRTLTRREYDTLDAICARIIPTDDSGPGAREARAARYIDWGLSGALAGTRPLSMRRRWRPSRPTRWRQKARRSRRCRRPIRTPSSPTCRRTACRRLPPRLLQHAAGAHDSGNVFRSVLRRERQLRRLGPDRISGCARRGARGVSAMGHRAQTQSPVGVRHGDVLQRGSLSDGDHAAENGSRDCRRRRRRRRGRAAARAGRH